MAAATSGTDARVASAPDAARWLGTSSLSHMPRKILRSVDSWEVKSSTDSSAVLRLAKHSRAARHTSGLSSERRSRRRRQAPAASRRSCSDSEAEARLVSAMHASNCSSSCSATSTRRRRGRTMFCCADSAPPAPGRSAGSVVMAMRARAHAAAPAALRLALASGVSSSAGRGGAPGASPKSRPGPLARSRAARKPPWAMTVPRCSGLVASARRQRAQAARVEAPWAAVPSWCTSSAMRTVPSDATSRSRNASS
mmetsp:Transcript_14210/g.43078  ORF Transcript_14210/g.43078 Transcript_14210/m.43078 type:complete len:254 (-) Transcript_14210:183-944(-)